MYFFSLSSSPALAFLCVRSGATTWPGPQRSTAAHVATMSAVVAAVFAVAKQWARLGETPVVVVIVVVVFVVVVFCCCCCSEESLNVCMATAPKSCKLNEANLHPAAQHLRVNSRRQRHPRGALDDEELFIVEGSKKLALNSGITGGTRKMAQNAPKNHSSPS